MITRDDIVIGNVFRTDKIGSKDYVYEIHDIRNNECYYMEHSAKHVIESKIHIFEFILFFNEGKYYTSSFDIGEIE